MLKERLQSELDRIHIELFKKMNNLLETDAPAPKRRGRGGRKKKEKPA
jgi:hypothetical protein